MKAVLVLNAGSSSLKFALYPVDGDVAAAPAVSGQVEGIGARPEVTFKTAAGERIQEPVVTGGSQGEQHRDALEHVFALLVRHNPALDIVAAGHRIVHGGEHYSAPTRLDEAVLRTLDTFVPLAPLHQPHNLRAVRAVATLMPQVPQVGCFDTAFHRTQPAVAQAFALPRRLSAEGIKRYGFHGLSYEYIARALPQHSGRATGRVVVAHLGNGASMAAMVDRKCVATTLGFSTIDGLMMGTRCGNLDPGVILHLMETKNLSVKDMTRMLYKESGLLGVSGLSQDMRTLLASDKPEAAEAVNLFCYRIARELGSLAAAAGGLDALVFTGGIGEHAAEVRRRVCLQSEWLGIRLNPEANARHELRISAGNSSVDVLVIPANEEWMMGHHAQTLLAL